MNFSGIRITRMLKLASVLAALTISVSVGATQIGDVNLDDTARVANQELKLNGAGIRYKAIFKVYVAGLYLADKKATVPDVLAAPGARRVTIVMLRDVGSEEFSHGFMQGIHDNSTRAETTKIVMQLLKFGEIFASIPELKKGDVLTTDWIPGSGTVIHLNGKKVAEAIPDIAFYNAILRIWIGKDPVDSTLKQRLLGQKDESRNMF